MKLSLVLALSTRFLAQAFEWEVASLSSCPNKCGLDVVLMHPDLRCTTYGMEVPAYNCLSLEKPEPAICPATEPCGGGFEFVDSGPAFSVGMRTGAVVECPSACGFPDSVIEIPGVCEGDEPPTFEFCPTQIRCPATVPCSQDCVLSPWSDWSGVCSAPCGGGVEMRTREVLIPAAGDGICDFPLIQERLCNAQPCEVPVPVPIPVDVPVSVRVPVPVEVVVEVEVPVYVPTGKNRGGKHGPPGLDFLGDFEGPGAFEVAVVAVSTKPGPGPVGPAPLGFNYVVDYADFGFGYDDYDYGFPYARGGFGPFKG